MKFKVTKTETASTIRFDQFGNSLGNGPDMELVEGQVLELEQSPSQDDIEDSLWSCMLAAPYSEIHGSGWVYVTSEPEEVTQTNDYPLSEEAITGFAQGFSELHWLHVFKEKRQRNEDVEVFQCGDMDHVDIEEVEEGELRDRLAQLLENHSLAVEIVDQVHAQMLKISRKYAEETFPNVTEAYEELDRRYQEFCAKQTR